MAERILIQHDGSFTDYEFVNLPCGTHVFNDGLFDKEFYGCSHYCPYDIDYLECSAFLARWYDEG